MWPALTILLALALVVLHFWWRRKFAHTEHSLRGKAAGITEHYEDKLNREKARN